MSAGTDVVEDGGAEGARRMSAPIDTVAAEAFWSAYAAAHPEAVRVCDEYTVERFGDSAELGDELLGLVLDGGKRATAELVDEYVHGGDPIPRPGSHWVVCDSTGAPRLVLRSVELRLGPFTSVDAAFAADEGEGDLSLECWREGHARYWTRTCAARGAVWSESDEIVFERFRVVWPPEHAD